MQPPLARSPHLLKRNPLTEINFSRFRSRVACASF
jgi:hypothetical protein